MDLAAARASIRSLPRPFLDKHRRSLRLELLPQPLERRLVEMYLAFRPRNSFQGLPPLRDEVCVRWVEDMVRTGINIVATVSCGTNISPPSARQDAPATDGAQDGGSAGRRVVGHTALFPIDACKCETFVAVEPESQGLGIGTELTWRSIAAAAELGFQRLWLSVETVNVRARHVYEKCGYQYVSWGTRGELEMVYIVLSTTIRCEVGNEEPSLSSIASGG